MTKISNAMILNLVKWVAVIIFSAGSIYTVVHFRLNVIEGEVKYIKEENIPEINENKLELVGVKKDIGYLSEKVDRNYYIQQQILTEVKELQR